MVCKSQLAAMRRALLKHARDDAHGEATPDRFLRQTFQVERNVPSPGLGMFDATFEPRSGKMTVTTKVALHDPETHVADPATYRREFRELIPEFWNDKFMFRCTRAGWEVVVARPEFAVDIVPEGQAYFIPEIKKHKSVEPSAFISMDISVRNANQLYPARHAQLEEVSTSRAVKTTYMEGAIKSLRYFEVPVLKKFSSSAIAQKVLDQFAKQFVLLVPKTRPVEVRVTAVGGDSRLDRKALQVEAEKFLTTRGVKNLCTSYFDDRTWAKVKQLVGKGKSTSTTPESPSGLDRRELARVQEKVGDQLRLIVEVDEQELTEAIRSSERSMNVFAQPTVVHEYGHMLGLPDEYRCMIMQTAEKMAASGLISPNHVDRWVLEQTKTIATHDPGKERDMESERFKAILKKYENNADAKKIYMDYMTTIPHATSVLKQQEAFIKLCQKAGITPPLFGRKTASMMAAGTMFHEQHAVTIWECLTRITRFWLDQNEWQIEMV